RRLGIEPVGDAQVTRRFLGELHESARAGFAGRHWIPLRFLIGDCSEQPPFGAARRLRIFEYALELRQLRLDAIAEYAGVDPLDTARRIEITLRVAGERAVPAQTRKVLIERIAKRRVPGRHRPRE